jgi:hypothetical protein
MLNNNIPMQRPEEEELNPLFTSAPIVEEKQVEQQPQFVNFQEPQQAEQAQMQPSQLQTGIDLQKQSLLEQAQIEGDQGSEMAKVYGQAEQQMQKKQADFEIKQQDRMKEVENLTRKFENQQQAIKEMSLKGVDWWGSKTTGEKITAGIGLFLSALSNQSMKNTLDIIDREVDRDLKIQQANIEKAQQLTANNTGLTLNVAANYGGRWDIANAAQQLAIQVAAGQLQASDINEQLLSKHIQMHEQPELDLMIRTGGDIRISNFLLWQAAYAELCFIDTLWPDFDDRLSEFKIRLKQKPNNIE